jgi:hypothetical protein
MAPQFLHLSFENALLERINVIVHKFSIGNGLLWFRDSPSSGIFV